MNFTGLDGKWSRLRPVVEDDLPYIYTLALDARTNYRWRYRSQVPNFATFIHSLPQVATAAEFIVTSTKNDSPLGHASVHNLNLRDRTAYISAAFSENHATGLGRMVEAQCLLLTFAFDSWDLRKVYIEGPESEAGRAAFRSLFHEEGRFTQHIYSRGKYCDSVLLGLFRSTWEARSAQISSLAQIAAELRSRCVASGTP